MRYLLLVCLCLAGACGAAARPPVPPGTPDTLRLQAANNGPWARYFAYCFVPFGQPATGPHAVALAQAGRFRLLPERRVFQAGYTRDRLWLRAVVVNTLPQRTRFVWSLYAFVDSAVLYVQPGGLGAARRVLGTSGRTAGPSRPLASRALCLPFWLEAGQTAVAYLRVDNFTGATYLPTDLTTTEDFLAYEANFFATKRWAWLLGLYVGSALFNFILYALLRDPIHLWYGAYVGFSSWFLLMEDGLDAVLLPAGLSQLGWQLGQYSILLLALGCGLRILALFVHLRQGWPRLHRLSWVLSGLAATMAPAYAALLGPAVRAGAGALAGLNGSREVLLWGLLLAGAGALAGIGALGRPVQRRLAALYGLTYGPFFLGCVNFLLNRTGMVNIHLAEPNALAWGLALELLTLSALLTGRFRHALRLNAELRVRRLRERTTAGQRLIEAQEEERTALARELHDALAPGLTALHLAWQGRQVRQALAEAPGVLLAAHEQAHALLRQLRAEVRTFSQALLPPSLPSGEVPPLPTALDLLAHTLSLADEGPHLSWHCDPAAAELPPPVQRAAYRMVAELLHNALRHAQAAHIEVQVQCLPAHLRLRIADDGCGFDPAQPPRQGLGLRGVRARAGYLRGQVRISSRPDQGTAVVVDLPID